MGLLSSSTFLFTRGLSIKEHDVLSAAQILESEEEVGSSSTCCYDDHSSYYTTSLSFPPPYIIKYPANSIDNTINTDNFSIIFDEEITEHDVIINSVDNLDFNLPPPHDLQFDLTLLQNHLPLTTDDHNTTITPYPHQNDHVVPVMGGPAAALPTVCEDDDCLSSMPPSKLMRRFNNSSSSAAASCSFMDPSSLNLYLSAGNSKPPAATLPAVESSFGGNNFFLGSSELDFKGDINGGIFSCPDLPLPTPNYNSINELQALSPHLVNPILTTEITSLEEETYRVAAIKLTTEERREKIHRYMKKRNERNFSKKIKYACRKTLADRRPRVRGRFAKNDEFGENINRITCNLFNEEDTDEDVKSFHVTVKEEEEEENLESSSSDIFAHISGVNSFKCNYPIQSWI